MVLFNQASKAATVNLIVMDGVYDFIRGFAYRFDLDYCQNAITKSQVQQ
jgi:hypothetical protein